MIRKNGFRGSSASPLERLAVTTLTWNVEGSRGLLLLDATMFLLVYFRNFMSLFRAAANRIFFFCSP